MSMRPKSLKIQSFKSEISQQHHKQDQSGNLFAQLFAGMIPKSNTDQKPYEEPDNISEIHSNKTSHSSSMEESLIVENGILDYPKEEKFSGFKVIKVEMNSESSSNMNKNLERLRPKPKEIKLLDSIIYEVSDCNESVNYNSSAKELDFDSGNTSLQNSIKSNHTSRINRSDSSNRRSLSKNKTIASYNKESAVKSKQFISTIADVSKNKIQNEPNVSEFDLTEKMNKVNDYKNLHSFRKTESVLVKEEEPSILPLDSRTKIKHDDSKLTEKKGIRSSKLIKKIEFEDNKHNESPFKNEKSLNIESNQFISTADVSKTSLESPIKEEQPLSNPFDIIAKIFGGSFSEKQTPAPDPKKLKEAEKTTEDMMIKFLADLGITESNREMEKIKNMMINQKNLKLKDYLRLTSLSSDSKFDRYSKSLTKKEIKVTVGNQNLLGVSQKSYVEEESSMLKSRSFMEKSKSPIDAERSIELIKASLKKKLDNSMKLSYNLFKEVDEGSNLVGQEYEDLVFMCNFHRVYDENMFKTVQLLEELFEQYQNKRSIKKNINEKVLNDEAVTPEDFIEMINSPVKKKKKNENIPLDFIQKLLLNLKIIKKSEIKSPKDSIAEFDS